MSRTQSILDEIARPGSTRESIAASYRVGQRGLHEFIDWPSVRRALRRRYTPSGVDYIDTLAWSRRRIVRTNPPQASRP